jgi:hypothetical protein
MKAARSRIRELETALADAHMDYCLESAFLEIACEKLGTTAEDLKNQIISYFNHGIARGSARDWRGLATPEAGPERSGAPESPVFGAERQKCALKRGYILGAFILAGRRGGSCNFWNNSYTILVDYWGLWFNTLEFRFAATRLKNSEGTDDIPSSIYHYGLGAGGY